MSSIHVVDSVTTAVIKAVLGNVLADKYTHGKLSAAELSAATGNIPGFREMFTTRSKEFGNYLNSDNQLNAYALYYLFPNLAKVTAILELCQKNDWLDFSENLTVADLGCGPGVGILGLTNLLLQNFSPENLPNINLTAIDQSAQALKLADRIFSNLNLSNLNLKLQSTDLTNKESSGLSGKFDLIIMANVVNELFRQESDSIQQRTNLLNNLIQQNLKENGLILIIEPALQQTSRELHKLRDKLLVNGDISLLAPCTHHNSCPMNEESHADDWCHEAHYWDNPPIIDQIDKLTGLNKHNLKYSFLLFSKSKIIPSENAYYATAVPLYTKGCVKVSACGSNGLAELIYSGKSKSSFNKTFKKIDKGSRFILSGANQTTNNNKIVISPEMGIEIL